MARPADPTARSALRSSARREFVKSGILRARIEDITHACGLSKGAFYLHFESKEALFRELVAELEAAVEPQRTARERAAKRFLKTHGAVSTKDLQPDSPFARAWKTLHTKEDRTLLELLWQWRDVIDVLLRGCQGTEFEGVIWTMLDLEVARVAEECETLKAMRLMRHDIHGDVLGLMMVGTYLLVARRMSGFTTKPDFDPWVTSLQELLANGTSPHQRRAPPRTARTRKRSPS